MPSSVARATDPSAPASEMRLGRTLDESCASSSSVPEPDSSSSLPTVQRSGVSPSGCTQNVSSVSPSLIVSPTRSSTRPRAGVDSPPTQDPRADPRSQNAALPWYRARGRAPRNACRSARFCCHPTERAVATQWSSQLSHSAAAASQTKHRQSAQRRIDVAGAAASKSNFPQYSLACACPPTSSVAWRRETRGSVSRTTSQSAPRPMVFLPSRR
mmetsp:Transcript_6572/g.21207  ORF Transcript_6572/g.21207 Transcript_6572/m.21207 type:complete len:214 (+) Transcript_6572:194-835(+)